MAADIFSIVIKFWAKVHNYFVLLQEKRQKIFRKFGLGSFLVRCLFDDFLMAVGVIA
jgi:hypothetical protein